MGFGASPFSSGKAARLGIVWGVALAWFGADLATKAWALRFLVHGEREVVPGVLWFNLVRNPGAAFGLFPRGQVVFMVVTVLLLGVGVWAPLVLEGRGRGVSLGHVGLGILVGGGLGNLFDRVFRAGLVVDFIDFRFWPIFNLADTGIVVGTALVFICLVWGLLRPGAKAA